MMVDLEGNNFALKDHGQCDTPCKLLWMDVIYLSRIAVFQN